MGHVRSGLRLLRHRRGESQSQVAKALGISPKTYSSIECGVRGVRLQLLPRMATHFGVSVEELLRVLDVPLDAATQDTMRYSSPNLEPKEVAEEGGEVGVPGSAQCSGGRDEEQSLAG